MKLTVKSTPALQLPRGKTDHIFWDDAFPGFGIRLRAGGSRNWVFQYVLGERQRRMSLGSATAVPLVKAREIAGELHAKVRLGQDPAGQKAENQQRASETFEAIGRKFLAHQKGELRPRQLSTCRAAHAAARKAVAQLAACHSRTSDHCGQALRDKD